MRVAALALALALATPAAATPYRRPAVQQSLGGYADLYVTGDDRVEYRVQLMAAVPDGVATDPQAWLMLFISRCTATKCGDPMRFYTRLTPAQYEARESRILTVRLPAAFGKPFAVTWTSSGGTGVPRSAGGAGYDVGVGEGWSADAAVTFLGRTCTTREATGSRSTTVHLTGHYDAAAAMAVPARPLRGLPSSARSCRGK